MMIQSESWSNFLSTTEQHIVKNSRTSKKEKIAHEQQSQKSTFSFVIKDTNFPHALASISPNIANLDVQWKRAQSLCDKANYSEDIDNLEKPCFSNRAITHVLLLLNWFVGDIFQELFQERKVKSNILYPYKVMIQGVVMEIYVDSFIPLKQSMPIFAEPVQNSIFSCLYEKLLAKIYGSYEAITQDVIDLLQIHTLYSKQLIPFYALSENQLLQKFTQCIEAGDLLFFRTRNSVGLETLGLQSSQPYIITRIIKVKDLYLCQFLQIDGESWIGKFSKVRAFWTIGHHQIQEQQLNLQQYGRENYIHIHDLVGVSRQFVILHNTKPYHKNWICVRNPLPKHCFLIKTVSQNHVYFNLNFLHPNCRSSLFLISDSTNQLIGYTFKQEKSSNFLQTIIHPNSKYFLYIEVEDITGAQIPFNLTIFSTEQLITPLEIQPNEIIQEKAYLSLVLSANPVKTVIGDDERSAIFIKNFIKDIGKAFIVIFLSKYFNGKLLVEMNHEKLKQSGLYMMNSKEDKLEYEKAFKSILVFKCRGKIHEEGQFPPANTLKITTQNKKHANNI